MPFQKGQSGNPGGRKAIPPEQKAEFINAAKQAPKVLRDIMLDKHQPGAVRVSAAVALQDRAHGKPSQSLTGENGGPVEIVVTYDANHKPNTPETT